MEVRNRFKGLGLIDRVTDELWTEVHDIVEETGIKTIPKKNKCKNAKWLSEEALHASEIMLKILQARLQQYVNPELTDIQAGFRKGR